MIGAVQQLFKWKPVIVATMTRLPLLALTLVAAVPAAAQTPVQVAARFNPAGDYITPGQDETGYRVWVASQPSRALLVQGFNTYLTNQGVAGVVPTWQLLRTATAWRSCGAEPFEIPPTSVWPNLVETLQYVKAHVIPVVGPVEPVSVYRNPILNQCAGGAADSAHRHLFAVDMVPLRPTSREAMIRGLCAIHAWQGSGFEVGLGFYSKLRFHIDSRKFRKWGADGSAGSIGCNQVLAEIEAAAAASRAAMSARQPAPPPATPAPTVEPLPPATR